MALRILKRGRDSMYGIKFMNMDGSRGFAAAPDSNVPMAFQTKDDAWEFIVQYMNAIMGSENRPRFMWVKELEVANANS